MAFSFRLWIEHYLKSDAFAAQLNATAGHALMADCRLEGISWQDSTGYAATFHAQGRENAVFRRLTVADTRAEVDPAAVWDRVWRVRQVRIAQMTLDFSAGNRAPAVSTLDSPMSSAPAQASTHGLQGWLPNRTEIGPVQVERFDFVRDASLGSHGILGEGFSLTLKPNLKASVLEVVGTGGTAGLTGVKKLLKVDRFRTTLRQQGASLDQLTGTLEDAAVTAEGTMDFTSSGDLLLKVSLAGASLEHWLPEDWLKRCSGRATAYGTLRGDWRLPGTMRADGDFKITGASLQALPLLDIIAKKTQNASFLRMQLKEVSGHFDRRQEGLWELRRLRADAPGLLRLKGSVNVGPGGALSGSLLLGVVPGTLRYLAGAEQTVFLAADHFSAATGNAGVLSPDDTALFWTRFRLGGTLDLPSEDLSERLAQAWFHATTEQVTALSMEAASTAARTAAGVAGAALNYAPPLLEKAPDLLNQGVQGGLKVLEGLLPR